MFTVTQSTAGTATNNYFNMPLVLDDTTVSPTVLNFLRYTKLGVGGPSATNSSQLTTTDSRTMMLRLQIRPARWTLSR